MLACTPHPGLGSISVRRGAHVQVVDLATCKTRTLPATGGATLGLPSGVRIRVTPHAQSIVYEGRTLYTVKEDHSRAPAGMPGPIVVQGISPDRRWILFAIDPQGSASLMADGLRMQLLSTADGTVHPLGPMLAYGDYAGWCGGTLFLTRGGDRIAWHDKQLSYVRPAAGAWQVQSVLKRPRTAWGSLACAGGRTVIAQQQPSSSEGDFYSGRWALWEIGLGGRETRLTRPPRGSMDESPRVSKDGRTILFVRARRGRGQLFALRDGRLVGPLLSLGYQLGYYGHTDWWQTMSWSQPR